jgi:hypothetical protein
MLSTAIISFSNHMAWPSVIITWTGEGGKLPLQAGRKLFAVAIVYYPWNWNH